MYIIQTHKESEYICVCVYVHACICIYICIYLPIYIVPLLLLSPTPSLLKLSSNSSQSPHSNKSIPPALKLYNYTLTSHKHPKNTTKTMLDTENIEKAD